MIVYNRLGSGPPQVLAMTARGTAVRRLGVGHAPEWSPDGRLIAFDNGQHIMVMKANGTATHDITPGLHDHNSIDPARSPDGRWIVFASEPAGTRNGALWLVRADGTDLHELVNAPGEEENASWSPDGKSIVFDSYPANGPDHLYIVGASGSGLRRITPDGLDAWGPAWSPRNVIAFSNGSGSDTSDIYTMRPDGSHLARLTSAPAGVSLGQVSFSPDGREIVYTRYSATFSFLYTMTVAGTDQRNLTRSQPGVNGGADWGTCLAPVD
jgi:TolB protein